MDQYECGYTIKGQLTWIGDGRIVDKVKKVLSGEIASHPDGGAVVVVVASKLQAEAIKSLLFSRLQLNFGL